MKPETVYESVVSMILAYGNMSGQDLSDVVKSPEKWTKCCLPFVAEAATLLQSARYEMDRKVSGGNILAAAKRIVKNASRADMAGTWECAGKWVYCDGSRMVRIDENLTSIPKVTGLSEDAVEKIMTVPHDLGTFCPPSVAEIKRHILDAKAQGKKPKDAPIEIAPNYFVNPQFLLDVMEMLPGAVFYTPANERAVLYMEARNGDAVLLPVRHF